MSDSYSDSNYYSNENQNSNGETYVDQPYNGNGNGNSNGNGSGRSWWLVILLLLLGVGIFVMWWCLCDRNETMKAYYERYIVRTRDSLMLVVSGLNSRIDSLDNVRGSLSNTIRIRDKRIVQLNSRIRYLLSNCDPVKYKRSLQRIKELEELVRNMETETATLKRLNNALSEQNKLLVTQIDSVSGAYDELYASYLNCCGKDYDKGGDDESLDGEFQVDGVDLTFVGLDRRGEEKPIKRVADIKRFDISFVAVSSKKSEHLFYVRITDSIEGNIVVPADYREEGKKILKLLDGEEVPYTYSVGYDYTTPNDRVTISSNFVPYSKQIRYLPYRVEIYDENGKLGETTTARIPPVKKTRRRTNWVY